MILWFKLLFQKKHAFFNKFFQGTLSKIMMRWKFYLLGDLNTNGMVWNQTDLVREVLKYLKKKFSTKVLKDS